MRISEFISFLQHQKAELGDIELFSEENDGRCSWAEPIKHPRIVYERIFPERKQLKKNHLLRL